MKLLSIVFILVFAFAAYGQTPELCDVAFDHSHTQTLGNAEGDINVKVIAAANCSWTVEPSNYWIGVLEGRSGTGSGNIWLRVTSNTQAFEKRTAWIDVNRARLTIINDPNCDFSIPAANKSFLRTGGSETLAVTASTGCGWSGISDSDWITVGLVSGGAGGGSFDYSVAVNSGAARTGTIRVGGRTLTITQEASKSRKRVRFF